ncbi:hypothetical protein QEH52_17935 [Coraliomargarita sp. SDUM461003]|uniref:Uncharacterized protein n=1 Tax=Thalassobacterium maritimum TaxID=3041265 RepID=A0ABU1AZ53_9BACT|nr:hypothetical protein [Coraliomargarita sp. SDUM461003]MDQ8209412.1 hypothetical protein [Coraliomargarita sp. SDUM461003]
MEKGKPKADLLNDVESAFHHILKQSHQGASCGLSIHERARLLEILRDLYRAESRDLHERAQVCYCELEDLLEKIEAGPSRLSEALQVILWRVRRRFSGAQQVA